MSSIYVRKTILMGSFLISYTPTKAIKKRLKNMFASPFVSLRMKKINYSLLIPIDYNFENVGWT